MSNEGSPNQPAYLLWTLFVICHAVAIHPALHFISDLVLPFVTADEVAYAAVFGPWYVFWSVPYWIAFNLPKFVRGVRKRSLLKIVIPLHALLLLTFPRVWMAIFKVFGTS